MSVDVLQEKIRKTKSPIMLDLGMRPEQIPDKFRQGSGESAALYAYCKELLDGLKGSIAGVRLHFTQWALLDGLSSLRSLIDYAHEQGYYVLMDGPAVLTPWEAQRAADMFDTFGMDGMVICPYIGSDAYKPFIPVCQNGKSLFLAVRTPNKSAAELQDMITGSRLVHVAAADHVKRHGETILGKCGYSQLGVLTAGTNSNAVMGLRTKYNRLFLLVDGLDYPGGNGKICSQGFDRFGHGCVISIGPSITAAWIENVDVDPIAAAEQAAERIRNNLSRYVSIL